MIYVDGSVLLADLFAEPRFPPDTFWDEDLASSRLLTYEVWNRINAYRLMISHSSRARGLLARVNLTEMSDAALARGAGGISRCRLHFGCAASRDNGISAQSGRISDTCQL